jgi:pilus assembly protein Flp/PilA
VSGFFPLTFIPVIQEIGMKTLMKFWKDEEGATAIEYGLIAGLIVVLLIVSLTTIGTQLKLVFSEIATATTAAGTAATAAAG